MKNPVLQRYFVVITAAITWVVLMMQFYLMLQNRVTSVPETIIRYFSFFTILTNILVAVYFSSLVLGPASRLYLFFIKPAVSTSVLLYILVVGIVYNTVLRNQWMPEGAQLVADNILHTVTPSLTLVYWLVYVPAGLLKWRQVAGWLLYPLVYCMYALIRGSLSGFYPYFFLDASELGLQKVILNSLIVTLVFLLLGILLIAIGNKKSNGRVADGR